MPLIVDPPQTPNIHPSIHTFTFIKGLGGISLTVRKPIIFKSAHSVSGKVSSLPRRGSYISLPANDLLASAELSGQCCGSDPSQTSPTLTNVSNGPLRILNRGGGHETV